MTPRRALLALIVLVALVRVAATHRVFSQTVDEPIHLAAGFEWLTTGNYVLDVEHPPLPRILFAAEPRLTGAAMSGEGDRAARGNGLLYRNDQYRRNLARVRAGNLPFLLLALVVAGLWAHRLFGAWPAVLAVAFLGTLPPVLGHAGLATTDMAAAASLFAAAYALDRWMETPSLRHAVVLSGAVTIGLLSKFTFLLYFPVWCAVVLVARRRRVPLAHVVTIVLVAALAVWAAYKFDVGTLQRERMRVFPPESRQFIAAKYASVPGYEWMRPDLLERFYEYANRTRRDGFDVDIVDWAKAAGLPSPSAGRRGNTLAGAPPLPPVPLRDRLLEPFRSAWQWTGANVPVPAPMFFVGAEYVRAHSKLGHPAFLFGETRGDGWWYYFPVVLFFKTPLAFIALALCGAATLRPRTLVVAPLLMLIPPMASSINIGVRHVLPLLPFFTLWAVAGAVFLWNRARPLAALLTLWLLVATSLAHPDYLAYFNEAAGRHPERIALDSNLDWGQDLLRLERVVREKNIPHLYVSYFGSADWRRHIPNGEDLPRGTPVEGWIAISEMNLVFEPGYEWLRPVEPVQRIGKSIRLYRIPQAARISRAITSTWAMSP